MAYLNISQLLFAILALIGMIYIFKVGERDKRYAKCLEDMKINLSAFNVVLSDEEKKELAKSSTDDALVNFYDNYFKKNEFSSNLDLQGHKKAAMEQIVAFKYFKKKTTYQKCLLVAPFALIVLFSLYLIWLACSFDVLFIKIGYTFVLLASMFCAFSIISIRY